MCIANQINQITNTRNTFIPDFQKKIDDISNWRQWAKDILDFVDKNSFTWNEIMNENPNLKKEWDSLCEKLVSFSEASSNAIGAKDGVNGVILEAFLRASRPYLNLGCIGPWRRGKSLVLQKITGLDTWIIPTSNANKCTGTTINVINSTYKVDGSVRIPGHETGDEIHNIALIYHYTVPEINTIINEYFALLNISLRVEASSKDAFKNFCDTNKREIHRTTDNPPVGMSGFCNTLNDYIDHVDEYYQDLDGNVNPILDILSDTSKRTYRPRVSFIDAPNGNVCYKVLATKSAEVFTHFTICGEEVGKIQLLDTPGIGEARVGVNKALREALKKDLDIAICLGKIAVGSDDDFLFQTFHELLKMETTKRNPEKWVFYLFNLWRNGQINEFAITSVKNKIIADLNKPVSTYPGIQLPDENSCIIDCECDKALQGYDDNGNVILSDEAGIQPFISNVLHLMAGTISDVDEVFYAQARIAYNHLNDEYIRLKNMVTGMVLPSYNTHNIIDKQIKKLRVAIHAILNINIVEDIQNNIQAFLNEPMGRSVALSALNNPDYPQFHENLESVIRGLNNVIANAQTSNEPKENLVITYLTQALGNVYEVSFQLNSKWDAYKEFEAFQAMRLQLLEAMQDDIVKRIDEKIANTKVQDQKKLFAKCLLESGLFGLLLPSSKPDTFWHDIINFLEKTGESYSSLMGCFKEFDSYKVQVRDAIEEKIRKSLKEQLHQCSFGTGEFSSAEWALISFISGLLSIENAIKDYISDANGTFNEVIKDRNRAFSDVCNGIKDIVQHNNEQVDNGLYNDLYNLYSNYQDIFFINDSSTLKQGVVARWRQLN